MYLCASLYKCVHVPVHEREYKLIMNIYIFKILTKHKDSKRYVPIWNLRGGFHVRRAHLLYHIHAWSCICLNANVVNTGSYTGVRFVAHFTTQLESWIV